MTPDLVTTQIGAPDVIVLDPARQGAGTDVTMALAAGHAATLRVLVYVACDPASFARDAGVLAGAGWRLDVLRGLRHLSDDRTRRAGGHLQPAGVSEERDESGCRGRPLRDGLERAHRRLDVADVELA